MHLGILNVQYGPNFAPLPFDGQISSPCSFHHLCPCPMPPNGPQRSSHSAYKTQSCLVACLTLIPQNYIVGLSDASVLVQRPIEFNEAICADADNLADVERLQIGETSIGGGMKGYRTKCAGIAAILSTCTRFRDISRYDGILA